MIRKFMHCFSVLMLLLLTPCAWGQGTQGAAANGTAARGNPVLMGGSDGANARTIKTDNTGQVYIANPGGVVTQSDQTALKGTMYQGGTWSNVGVTGTFWQSVQPVSGTFWQSVQPVSGTITANVGTTGGLALDATLTGGTQRTQIVGSGGNVAVVDSAGSQQVKGGFQELSGLSCTGLNSLLVPATDVSGYKDWSLQVSSISAAGTLTFQGSNDNSAWVSVPGNAITTIDRNAGSGYSSSAASTGLFVGSINYRYFRVQQTAGTGTSTGVLELNANARSITPVGAVSQASTWTTGRTWTLGSGTDSVTANVGTTNGLALDATLTGGSLKSQLVSSGGNVASIDSAGNLQTKGGFTEMSGLSSTGVNSDLVPATDVSTYKSWALQVTANAGTLTFQGSNDNSTFVNVNAYPGVNTTVSSATTVAVIVTGPIYYRYLRVRQTVGSGTSTGVLELYTTPFVTSTTSAITATQTGTWTVQPGNTPNSTPWLTTNTASASGGYNFSNLASNATTTVKSGAGTLHSITINTKGASANTATVYDNTAGSGTKIATIDTTGGSVSFTYDIAFSTGLTVVMSTGTAADLTVSYK